MAASKSPNEENLMDLFDFTGSDLDLTTNDDNITFQTDLPTNIINILESDATTNDNNILESDHVVTIINFLNSDLSANDIDIPQSDLTANATDIIAQSDLTTNAINIVPESDLSNNEDQFTLTVPFISPFNRPHVPPNVEIQQCSKVKGQEYDYRPEDKSIFIKRYKKAFLQVTGNTGLMFLVQVIYKACQHQQQSVTVCEKCLDEGGYPGQTFMTVTDEDTKTVLNQDGNGTFYMILGGAPSNLSMRFNCRNSCKPHNQFGKEIEIMWSFYAGNASTTGSMPIHTEAVALRVCENGKRDRGLSQNHKVSYKKKKNSDRNDTGRDCNPDFENQDVDNKALVTLNQRMPWIAFKMNNAEDQNKTEQFIQGLGGISCPLFKQLV